MLTVHMGKETQQCSVEFKVNAAEWSLGLSQRERRCRRAGYSFLHAVTLAQRIPRRNIYHEAGQEGVIKGQAEDPGAGEIKCLKRQLSELRRRMTS